MVTAEQIVVAAEVVQAAIDVEQLAPMVEATRATLIAAGVEDEPEVLAAEAGYWRAENVDGTIPGAPELFIAVVRHGRRGRPRRDGKPSQSATDHFVAAMQGPARQRRWPADDARSTNQREPLFGQIKHGRGARRFSRRGLPATQAEWKLLCATHNLLKLWRLQVATA